MRDEDWKTIVALHQHRTLTEAANALFVSQSALTKLLRRIEEELKITVATRTNKGFEFTAEGEFLFQQAKKMTAIMTETKKGLWEMKGSLAGTLKLGTSSSFARSQLPKLMTAYSAANGQVDFNVRVMLSTEVLIAVQNGTIDIGFINGDRDHHEKQVLCSTGNAYAIANHPIEKDNLRSMSMIMHNRDQYSRNIYERWWKNNFTEPMRVGSIVQDIDTSLNWVKDGLGYGVMFSNCLKEDEKFCRYQLLDNDGNPICRNTWAVCKRENADFPLVESFMTFIEELGPTRAD